MREGSNLEDNAGVRVRNSPMDTSSRSERRFVFQSLASESITLNLFVVLTSVFLKNCLFYWWISNGGEYSPFAVLTYSAVYSTHWSIRLAARAASAILSRFLDDYCLYCDRVVNITSNEYTNIYYSANYISDKKLRAERISPLQPREYRRYSRENFAVTAERISPVQPREYRRYSRENIAATAERTSPLHQREYRRYQPNWCSDGPNSNGPLNRRMRPS